MNKQSNNDYLILFKKKLKVYVKYLINSEKFLINLTAHAFFCFYYIQSKSQKKNNILLFNGTLVYNLAWIITLHFIKDNTKYHRNVYDNFFL